MAKAVGLPPSSNPYLHFLYKGSSPSFSPHHPNSFSPSFTSPSFSKLNSDHPPPPKAGRALHGAPLADHPSGDRRPRPRVHPCRLRADPAPFPPYPAPRPSRPSSPPPLPGSPDPRAPRRGPIPSSVPVSVGSRELRSRTPARRVPSPRQPFGFHRFLGNFLVSPVDYFSIVYDEFWSTDSFGNSGLRLRVRSIYGSDFSLASEIRSVGFEIVVFLENLGSVKFPILFRVSDMVSGFPICFRELYFHFRVSEFVREM
ncbi:pollen-specific leucine-rich repeat extensin-like protein 4 [Iris pallida]|uniref:Pollen-specific leucine-rich repeat extensin-like protein 4 n=1 Tax=Iris pallida TaxID=29817 RepID=A0AAX6ETQ0_IRIPA|nr:pollen-specific leucine-rich repeat extensin-like protein 4 [Iris pallida]